MSSIYPRYVFTSPGPFSCLNGTYDSIIVNDEKEHKIALESGFKDSIPDALDSKNVSSVEYEEEKPKRGRPKKEV